MSTMKNTSNLKAGPRSKNGCLGVINQDSRNSCYTDEFSKFESARILQKNVVYVIGLSQEIADEKILAKFDYFGQYGNITKLVVNKANAYNPSSTKGPSYSAYITYVNDFEAAVCILSVEGTRINGHVLRCSFGTTKYCTFFLRKQECMNRDCVYLHTFQIEEDLILKENDSTKNIFYEQQLLAIKIANIYEPKIKKKIINSKKFQNSVLPHKGVIFSKAIVKENDPINYGNGGSSKQQQNTSHANNQSQQLNNISNSRRNEQHNNHFKFNSDNYFDDNVCISLSNIKEFTPKGAKEHFSDCQQVGSFVNNPAISYHQKNNIETSKISSCTTSESALNSYASSSYNNSGLDLLLKAKDEEENKLKSKTSASSMSCGSSVTSKDNESSIKFSRKDLFKTREKSRFLDTFESSSESETTKDHSLKANFIPKCILDFISTEMYNYSANKLFKVKRKTPEYNLNIPDFEFLIYNEDWSLE